MLKSFACMVVFVVGLLTAGASAWAVCDTAQPTRSPTSRYVISGEIVKDKNSDLTWARCSVGQRWQEGVGCVGMIRQMVWNDALQQASGGWRVPTKDELATLISPTCKNPAINEEAFPGMGADKFMYWTSTENGASFAWVVNFDVGRTINDSRKKVHEVRLVRSGQ